MASAPLSTEAIGLVLVSALLHAGWNLLLKQAGGSNLVVAMSKVAEVVVFAPVFVWAATDGFPALPVVLLLTGVAATGVLGNYFALAAAYRHGDLSVVYPVSRGAALVFLPVLGAAFLDERPGTIAITGLLLIIAGILVLQLRALTWEASRALLQSLGSPAIALAVLAAFLVAVYTIWDKVALRSMTPFTYMYLYTVIVALAYGGWVLKRATPDERAATWRAHRGAIVGIGVMNMTSYSLTLLALKTDVSSLVIGLRQLSIVAGVALGAFVLGEEVGPPRRIGVAMIAAGCLAIALR